MIRFNRIFDVCLLILLLILVSTASSAVVGPAKGTLIIVGGGRDISISLNKFIELAGGKDAPIVVIPTAGGKKEYNRYWRGLQRFKNAGATNLTVLHTVDRQEANSEDFVKPIRNARGVWFSGGRQWRLADAYLNTLVHKELWALLERDGVIGGTSAGATIQGSFLVRGDTKTNTIMMGDHEEGLGFLKNVAIDQHLLKRNRQFDLINVIEKHPELLGIGIDENTGLMVHGDIFEVLGPGYVAVYDHNKIIPPGGRFYFLAPGDTYNLETRRAFRPKKTTQPIERVKNGTWK